MGRKEIYLGAYNNYKKEELLDMAKSYLEKDKGDSFLYILPNGSLLTRYRAYLVESLGVTRGQNIYTFDDIADRLAKRVDRKLISDRLREIIVEDIVYELLDRGQLDYYRSMADRPGFRKNLVDIIAKFKISLIRSEDYLSKLDKDDRSLYEIGLIYREYERVLDQYGLMDRDDKFLHTLDGLEENYLGFLKDIDLIIIDEFYDFRPQELAIIKELAKLDIDIYVNMPFAREDNFQVLLDTVDYLETLGFKLIEIEKEELDPFESLADSIFGQSQALSLDSIKFTRAANKKLEVKKMAEYIKKELAGGIELDDMALVLASDQYRPIVAKVFEEEKLPSSLSREENMLDLPLVRSVLDLLHLAQDWQKENFIRRINSAYSPLMPRESLEELDYHLRTSCLELDDLRSLHTDRDLDREIEKLFKELEEEREFFQGPANLKDYALRLVEFMDRDLEDNIVLIYRTTGDYDLFYRDMKTLEDLRSSLEAIGELDEELFKEMDLGDFIDIFTEYLEGESLELERASEKGIRVLTPSMLRGHRYRIVFMLGLTQGEYPSLSSKNFFFKEERGDFFRELGLDYKNYYEKLDKESMNFSLALSQVEERLYLSYSENASDNDGAIASIFLDELIYQLKEKPDFIELELDGSIKKSLEDVTNLEDYGYYILNKEEVDQSIYGNYNYLRGKNLESIYKRSYGEGERLEGLGIYSGVLKSPDIIEDLAGRLEARTFSISFLESYGACPYYFMVNKIFRLDSLDREVEEFSNLDRGTINHSVLQNFFLRYKEGIEDYILEKGQLDWEEIRNYLVESYRQGLEEKGLRLDQNLYRLKLEANVEKIYKYIEADLNRLRSYKKKLLPLAYEEDFGRREEFKLDIGDRKLAFTGVIDRIDGFADGSGHIVMDYKNTSYGVASDEDIRRGVSLQMPVYMMSQENRNIVGAAYGVIGDQSLELVLIDEDEKELVGRKRRGVYSKEALEEILEISKAYIGEYIDRIARGDFRLEPKECSEYCPYRKACRIGRGLELDHD